MNNPEKQLLVTAICVGDIGTRIEGYYHYDESLNQHYVCLYPSLLRKEVLPETVEFVNAYVNSKK